MFNTIILKKGYRMLTRSEYAKFEKGDTIYGSDSNPTELKRYPISQKDLAYFDLNKFRCVYDDSNSDCVDIIEYALEFCECDQDGDFIQGSNYDFAPVYDFD